MSDVASVRAVVVITRIARAGDDVGDDDPSDRKCGAETFTALVEDVVQQRQSRAECPQGGTRWRGVPATWSRACAEGEW
jgi:hypothetical protein